MSWYTVKESHDNGEYRVRYEFDLLAHAMEVLEARHAEMDDRAFEVALAEIGYVKQRTCHIEYHYGEWYCHACGQMVGTRDTASILHIAGNAIDLWGYCPMCGAQVVE